jgi:hypothetical protein
MRLFCFGYGYSAEALVRKLSPRLASAAGTRTSLPDAAEPAITLATYTGDGPSPEVRRLLEGATHVLVSIPPDLEGDAVLRHFADDLAALPDLAWIGYLSTSPRPPVTAAPSISCASLTAVTPPASA